MIDLFLSVLGGLFGDLQTVLLLIVGVVAGFFGVLSRMRGNKLRKVEDENSELKTIVQGKDAIHDAGENASDDPVTARLQLRERQRRS